MDADGVDLTPVRLQQRALLALLLLRAGEVVGIDDLVEGLWGSRPPKTAQKALHGHISALRKRLGAERIETRPPGYRLRLAEDDELDAHRFERVVATARADGPAARSRKLREALALFRGAPLSDFRYDEFAAPEAVRLEELRLTVVEEQIEAELELGRHAEVVPQLERLVVDHPLRERMRAQLMLALYRAGRQADALQAFQEGRTRLVDELGIDPGPALQRLERQILNHDPELAATSPERTLASARASLPRQPTPLIGREREIEEVTDLRVPIRLVLAEDHYLVREGILRLLEARPDLDVVAVCDDLSSLLAAVEAERPDVVLTDIRMPPSDTDEGIQAAERLRETHPEIGVVVLSQYANPAYALALFQGGSARRAYLLKERVTDLEELEAAIRAVAGGGSVIDSKVVDALVAENARRDDSPLSQLTPRERDVLRGMAEGKNNAAIADALLLTERSVEKVIHSIFLKLGLTWETAVHKRVKAVILYLAEGT